VNLVKVLNGTLRKFRLAFIAISVAWWCKKIDYSLNGLYKTQCFAWKTI
jgi:hypothetical protein